MSKYAPYATAMKVRWSTTRGSAPIFYDGTKDGKSVNVKWQLSPQQVKQFNASPDVEKRKKMASELLGKVINAGLKATKARVYNKKDYGPVVVLNVPKSAFNV
jgi:hypothetical protein